MKTFLTSLIIASLALFSGQAYANSVSEQALKPCIEKLAAAMKSGDQNAAPTEDEFEKCYTDALAADPKSAKDKHNFMMASIGVAAGILFFTENVNDSFKDLDK